MSAACVPLNVRADPRLLLGASDIGTLTLWAETSILQPEGNFAPGNYYFS
jgi:hypothetical protein